MCSRYGLLQNMHTHIRPVHSSVGDAFDAPWQSVCSNEEDISCFRCEDLWEAATNAQADFLDEVAAHRQQVRAPQVEVKVHVFCIALLFSSWYGRCLSSMLLPDARLA